MRISPSGLLNITLATVLVISIFMRTGVAVTSEDSLVRGALQLDIARSGLLLQLPYGATTPYPDWSVDMTAILHSLDLNQTEPGNQQTFFVYKGVTITVTGRFQRYQGGGGGGAILQAFFIYSWTPSMPPTVGYYYPLYDDAPGTGIQSFSFDLTVPNKGGVYYLYFGMGAEYSMPDAVNKYKGPLWVPYAVIVVGD